MQRIHTKNASKRTRGINTAITKLTREGEGLDEWEKSPSKRGLEPRSSNYRFTIDPHDPKDGKKLSAHRAAVKRHNKSTGSDNRLEVMHRLGKDNPSAGKYKDRRAFSRVYRVAKKDATRSDVYLRQNSKKERYD